MNFNLPTPEFSKYLGGTAFDASTGRLYISQKTAGPSATPIIHVYQLGAKPASGFLASRVAAAPVAVAPVAAAVGTSVTPQPSPSPLTTDSIALTNPTTHNSLTSKHFIRKQTKLKKPATAISESRSTNRTTAALSMETEQLDHFFNAISSGDLGMF